LLRKEQPLQTHVLTGEGLGFHEKQCSQHVDSFRLVWVFSVSFAMNNKKKSSKSSHILRDISNGTEEVHRPPNTKKSKKASKPTLLNEIQT
jgi:hypothetical protein